MPLTGINAGPLAEVSDGTLHVTFSAAPPTTLHDGYLWRTDGNSPLAIRDGVATVFFSGYEPRGHTLRRVGGRDLRFEAPPLPVMIVDDPDPASGKWIEAAWRAPGGLLIAWCHVEAPAPDGRLVLPRIDWMTSLDDGLVWQWRGTLVRLPPEKANLGWRNGFFAGGFGDLCLVPDRADRWLYLFHSSYHPDEAAQGVAVLRLPADCPEGVAELWTGAGWCRDPGLPHGHCGRSAAVFAIPIPIPSGARRFTTTGRSGPGSCCSTEPPTVTPTFARKASTPVSTVTSPTRRAGAPLSAS